MKFSASTLLQAAVCASSVSALSIPTLKTPRAAPDSTQSVSFTGTLTNGELVAGDAPTTPDSQDLQRRGGKGSAAASPGRLEARQAALAITLAVIAFVGEAAATAIITDATTDAYEAVKSLVTDVSQWNDAREVFTQNTTSQMWANNPDYAAYPAAVCYNKAYTLTNATGYLAKGSVTLTVGVLHTDYDCLYMAANNTFVTDDEGGYINLAYEYDSNKCTFDQTTGDLACTA